jgi:AraC-like DNA-binding protein
MDKKNICYYLKDYPRHTQGIPHLHNVGFMGNKTDHVHTKFNTTNFSFIFKGNGYLQAGEMHFDVIAPCVILEVAHTPYHYGPYESWQEVYFTYNTPAEVLLNRWELKAGQYLWPMNGEAAVIPLAEKIYGLNEFPGIPGTADILDRLAEMMILESLWGYKVTNLDPASRKIQEAERYIREHFTQTLDLAALASQSGFSLASFRRHWNRQFPTPPAQLINHLRLEKARKMLQETDEDIQSIAYTAGFNDALYFSRTFHSRYGQSPTSFRKNRL